MELWHVPLQLDAARAERAAAVLDADERARAARYMRERDRLRFIAAHVALRHILARACGSAPASLSFTALPRGKPALAHPAGLALEFNLSHSGDDALVAVSPAGAPVGVDLEVLERAEERFADLQSVYSSGECEAIAALPSGQQPLASYRCWVRKEALMKAAACGFTEDTRNFSVSVGEEAQLLASQHPLIETGAWSMVAVERPSHWTGALVVRGPMPRVAIHAWNWDE